MRNELFTEHSILGLQPQIIKSDESYNIVLIGSSSLATKILYQMAILSNLPEENILNLYLIDPQAKKFYKKIKKLFSGIEKIPHLNIKVKKLDSKNPKFYTNKIWKKKNLTNIIIATEDENRNFEIKTKLKKSIFTKKTKLLSPSNSSLTRDKSTSLAKLIYHLYKEDKYNPNLLFTKQIENDAQKLWSNEASKNDKKSSKAQSLHINTKLLALGLKKQKSTKASQELLQINRKIFNEKLGIDGENFNPNYIPEKYETLFDKLIRSEHNRWNTYHYLNGWKYSKIRNNLTKEHDCLKPLEEFDTHKLKATVIYDIFSIVYIPNLLASAGIRLTDARRTL